MNRTACSETMSQSSNSHDQSSIHTVEKDVTRPKTETVPLQTEGTSFSPRLLQAYLGEFLVQELREAIHSASHRIIENNQKIEALEEKVRGYEDHIDCLEQLVRELQLMLRTTIAVNAPVEKLNASHEVHQVPREIASPSFVEIPLEETDHKPVDVPASHQRASSASRLLSYLCKPSETKSLLSEAKNKDRLNPKSSEARVDINDGSLSDFN